MRLLPQRQPRAAPPEPSAAHGWATAPPPTRAGGPSTPAGALSPPPSAPSHDERPALGAIPWPENSSWAQWSVADGKPRERRRGDDGLLQDGVAGAAFDPKGLPARGAPRREPPQALSSLKSPRQRRSDASAGSNASFSRPSASNPLWEQPHHPTAEALAPPAGASLRRVDQDLSGHRRRRRTDRRSGDDSCGGGDAPATSGATTLTSILKRASRSPTLQQTLSTASSNSINNFLRGLVEDDATGSDEIDWKEEPGDPSRTSGDLFEDGETDCTGGSGDRMSLASTLMLAAESRGAQGGIHRHAVTHRNSVDSPLGIPTMSHTSPYDTATNGATGQLGIGSPNFSTRIPRSLDEVIRKNERRTQKGGGGRLGIESRVDVFQPGGYFHRQDSSSDRLSTFGGTDVAIGSLTPRRHDFSFDNNALRVDSYEESKDHEIRSPTNSIQADSDGLFKLMNRLDTGEFDCEAPKYQKLEVNHTPRLGSSLPYILQRSPGSLCSNTFRASGKSLDQERFTNSIASESSIFAANASDLRNLGPLISDLAPSSESELNLTPPSPPPEFRRERLTVNSEPILRYQRSSPEATYSAKGTTDEGFQFQFASLLKEYHNKERLGNKGLGHKYQQLSLHPAKPEATEKLMQKQEYPSKGFVRWEFQESHVKVDADSETYHSIHKGIECIQERQDKDIIYSYEDDVRDSTAAGSSLERGLEFPLLQQRLAESQLKQGILSPSALKLDEDSSKLCPVPAQTHKFASRYDKCKSWAEALQPQSPHQIQHQHSINGFISPSHQEKTEILFSTTTPLVKGSPSIQQCRQIQSEPPYCQSRATGLQIHYNSNQTGTRETVFDTSMDPMHYQLSFHEKNSGSEHRRYSFDSNHSLSKQQKERHDCGSDFSYQLQNKDDFVSAADLNRNSLDDEQYAHVLLSNIAEDRASLTQFEGLPSNFLTDHHRKTHDEHHLVLKSPQWHHELPKHLRPCHRDPPHGGEHLSRHETAKKEPEGRIEQEKSNALSVPYGLDEDTQSTQTIVSVTDIFENLDDAPGYPMALLSGTSRAVSKHAISTMPAPSNAGDSAYTQHISQSLLATGDNGDVDSQTAVLGEQQSHELPEDASSHVGWRSSWAGMTTCKQLFNGTAAGKQATMRSQGTINSNQDDVAPVETEGGWPIEEKQGPTANIRNYWSAVVGVKTMGSFDSTTQNGGDIATIRGATTSLMNPERKLHKLRVSNPNPTPTSTASYMLPPPPPSGLPSNYTPHTSRSFTGRQHSVKKIAKLPPKTVQIPQVSEEALYDMRPLFSADSEDMETLETGQDTDHRTDSGAGCSFFLCGELSEWLPKCF